MSEQGTESGSGETSDTRLGVSVFGINLQFCTRQKKEVDGGPEKAQGSAMQHKTDTLRQLFPRLLRTQRILKRLNAAGITITSERRGRRAVTLIQGETWTVRDAIRSMGATWDATTRAWVLPIEHKADFGTICRALQAA